MFFKDLLTVHLASISNCFTNITEWPCKSFSSDVTSIALLN